MQTKNERVCNEHGIPQLFASGEIGLIDSLKDEDNDDEITVLFENSEDGTVRPNSYTEGRAKHLRLAYAYTVHKSQGSQADVVITCIHPMHYKFLKRNIIYTAVTRAKKEAWIIGDMAALRKAIATEDKLSRRTVINCLTHPYTE